MAFKIKDGVNYNSLDPTFQKYLTDVATNYKVRYPKDNLILTDGARAKDGIGSPTSWHKSNLGADFASDGLANDPEARNYLVSLLNQGSNEVIDEYTNPSEWSTGGHIHFGGMKDTPAENKDVATMNNTNNINNSQSSVELLKSLIGNAQPDYNQKIDYNKMMEFMKSGQNNEKQYNNEMYDKSIDLQLGMMGNGFIPLQYMQPYMNNGDKILEMKRPYEEEKYKIQNKNEIIDNLPAIMEEYQNSKNPMTEALIGSALDSKAGMSIPSSNRYITPKDELGMYINASNIDRANMNALDQRNWERGMEEKKFNLSIQQYERQLSQTQANIEKQLAIAKKTGDTESFKELNNLNQQLVNIMKLTVDDKQKQQMATALTQQAVSRGLLQQGEHLNLLGAFGEFNPNAMGDNKDFQDYTKTINGNYLFNPK